MVELCPARKKWMQYRDCVCHSVRCTPRQETCDSSCDHQRQRRGALSWRQQWRVDVAINSEAKHRDRCSLQPPRAGEWRLRGRSRETTTQTDRANVKFSSVCGNPTADLHNDISAGVRDVAGRDDADLFVGLRGVLGPKCRRLSAEPLRVNTRLGQFGLEGAEIPHAA